MEVGRWPRAKYLRIVCLCFNDAEKGKDDRKACMLGGKKGWLQYWRDRNTENEMNTYKSTLALGIKEGIVYK